MKWEYQTVRADTVDNFQSSLNRRSGSDFTQKNVQAEINGKIHSLMIES